MTNLIVSDPVPVAALATQLRRGDLLLLDYLAHLEARFEEVEPQIHSFVPETGRFDRLRGEAQELLSRYPQPAERPPLFGLTVGVKDIFHVDGFETHAGSSLPPAVLQGQESAVVTALKRAGALILGKTVTTEFAYFGPGPTRNPHNTQHTPGGSSSGSAAAVAAGLSPLTLGTQTIGSVNRPAAFCGVAGLKPSHERLSRIGVIPLSPSLDHVGIFAQSAGDIRKIVGHLFANELPAHLDSRPALAVPDGPYLDCASGEALTHFESQLERLRSAGYVVKRISAMPDFDQIAERHNQLVAADAAQVHAAWFAEFGDRYHPKTVELIERGFLVSATERQTARDGRALLRRQLVSLMQENQVDLWITPPAVGPAPRGLESTGDPVMNLPWTQAGLPSLTLPAGVYEEGLPLGIQLIGGWHKDEQLLCWGEALEAIL